MPDGINWDSAGLPVADDDGDAGRAAANFERNKHWTRPGVTEFQTKLSPEDEKRFQAWVKGNKVPFEDGPEADYDMRGFWKASQDKTAWKQLQKDGSIPPDLEPAGTKIDPNDGKPHYPDYWKTPFHETFSNESQFALHGAAPAWNKKDQLVAGDGTVLFDDKAQNKPASAPPAQAGTQAAAQPAVDWDSAGAVVPDEAAATPATPPADAPKPTMDIGSDLKSAGREFAGMFGNFASDPFGNIIGKPLAAGLQFAHDALAPVFGYERFPTDTRNWLLSDNVPQPGTRAVDAAAKVLGVPDIPPPQTDADVAIRKGTTGALGGLTVGGPIGAVIGGAGAVAGHYGVKPLPDWAQPAAEEAINLGAGIAAAKAPDLARRPAPTMGFAPGDAGGGAGGPGTPPPEAPAGGAASELGDMWEDFRREHGYDPRTESAPKTEAPPSKGGPRVEPTVGKTAGAAAGGGAAFKTGDRVVTPNGSGTVTGTTTKTVNGKSETTHTVRFDRGGRGEWTPDQLTAEPPAATKPSATTAATPKRGDPVTVQNADGTEGTGTFFGVHKDGQVWVSRHGGAPELYERDPATDQLRPVSREAPPEPTAKPEAEAEKPDTPVAKADVKPGHMVTFKDKAGNTRTGTLMGTHPKSGQYVVDMGAGPHEFVKPENVVSARTAPADLSPTDDDWVKDAGDTFRSLNENPLPPGWVLEPSQTGTGFVVYDHANNIVGEGTTMSDTLRAGRKAAQDAARTHEAEEPEKPSPSAEEPPATKPAHAAPIDDSWVKNPGDVADSLARNPLPPGWEIGIDHQGTGYNVYDHNDKVVARAPTMADALRAGRKAAAAQPGSADLANAPNGPWAPVGKNEAGQTVYQNPNGVNAVNENGVPFTEATKDGKPANPKERTPTFKIVEPTPEQPVVKTEAPSEQAAPKPEPAAPKEEAAPKPDVVHDRQQFISMVGAFYGLNPDEKKQVHKAISSAVAAKGSVGFDDLPRVVTDRLDTAQIGTIKQNLGNPGLLQDVLAGDASRVAPSASPAPKAEEPKPAEPKPAPKPAAAAPAAPKGRPVYSGSGRADQASVYNPNGAAVPIAGKGKYWAFTEGDAKNYGPNIETGTLDLKNPLVITSDDQWRALTKRAGWEFPNPFGQPPDKVEAATERLKDIVTAAGHDGVVFDWDDSSEGDIDDKTGDRIKTLRDVIGHPQAVDYRPQKAAPAKPAAPTQTAAPTAAPKAPAPTTAAPKAKPPGAVMPPGDKYYPPVHAGEQLWSKSGRALAPVPNFTVDTNRAANIGRAKLDEWLLNEARKEAEATGDRYLADILSREDAKNFPPMSRTMAIETIWGNDLGPKPEHRTAPAAPAAAPPTTDTTPLPPDIAALAEKHGIPTEGRTPQEIADDIAAKLTPAQVTFEIDKLGKDRQGAYQEAEKEAIDWIGYHGTPHLFPPVSDNPLGAFDKTKIGTGEGAQTFGVGHYVAENQEVGDGYRVTVTRLHTLTPEMVDSAHALADAIHASNRKSAELMDRGVTFDSPEYTAAMAPFRAAIDAAKAGHIEPPEGYLYTVRVKAKPAEMLDWDKPLSEQAPYVKAALQSMDRVGTAPRAWDELAGDWYRGNAGDAEASADLSADLQRAGIKGIRYLDEGSRGTAGGTLLFVDDAWGGWQARILPAYSKDGMNTLSPKFGTKAEAETWADKAINGGTRNVVVFDDKDLEIIDRNGEKISQREKIYGQPQDRTEEDLEHEQANAAPAAEQRPAGDGQPGPAAEDQGQVSDRPPEGGGDAGTGSGDEAQGGQTQGQVAPAGVTIFRSGANNATDFRAYVELNAPVGVSLARPLDDQMVIDYAKSGGQVFVDSGAFTEFTKGKKVDFPKVLDRYLDIADRAGGARLHFVMPDVIGDQGATLALIEEHAGKIKELIELGQNVLVPLQKGELTPHQVWQTVRGILGTDDFTAAIPFFQVPFSDEDLRNLYQDGEGPDRIHLLGIAGRKKKLAATAELLRGLNPDIEISADANRISAGSAQGRPITTGRAENLDRMLEGLWNGSHPDLAQFDETELAGSLTMDPGFLSADQAQDLARTLGVPAEQWPQWVKAAEDGDLGDLMEAADDEGSATMHWLRQQFQAEAEKVARQRARTDAVKAHDEATMGGASEPVEAPGAPDLTAAARAAYQASYPTNELNAPDNRPHSNTFTLGFFHGAQGQQTAPPQLKGKAGRAVYDAGKQAGAEWKAEQAGPIVPAAAPAAPRTPSPTARVLTDAEFDELDPVDASDPLYATLILPDGRMLGEDPRLIANHLGYGVGNDADMAKFIGDTHAVQVGLLGEDIPEAGGIDVSILHPLTDKQTVMVARFIKARVPATGHPVGVSYKGDVFEVESGAEFRAEVRAIDSQAPLDFSTPLPDAVKPPIAPSPAAPPADRPKDDVGNPIFKIGERVVIPIGRDHEGEHGEVAKVYPLSFPSGSQGKIGTSYSYDVRTDGGVTTFVSNVEPETGEAPAVAPAQPTAAEPPPAPAAAPTGKRPVSQEEYNALVTAQQAADATLTLTERDKKAEPEKLERVRQQKAAADAALAGAEGPPPKPTFAPGFGKTAAEVDKAWKADVAAHEDAVALRQYQEGGEPTPDPKNAYNGFAPAGKGGVYGFFDGAGHEWGGTTSGLVRLDADKGFPAMQKRSMARKSVKHLTGVDPTALDKVISEAGSEQPIAWKRNVSIIGDLDYTVGQLPDGTPIVVNKNYYDLMARAAGPGGTFSVTPAGKPSAKNAAPYPIGVRNAAGELVGLLMPINEQHRAAMIWATGQVPDAGGGQAAPPKAPPPKPTPAAPPAPAPSTGTTTGPHPEWATDFEKDVGGRVVYSDPEVALLEGYSILHGRPVYAGVLSDGRRTTRDIESYTGKEFTPAQLDRLKAAKAEVVARDQAAFEAHPDGPFAPGQKIAHSRLIKPSVATIATEWLNMLGLGDHRVFIADPRDVTGDAGDAYNLNGPYAAIRSAGVDRGEGGSMRRLSNGDYYIALAPRPRLSATLETLAHEIGHIVEREMWKDAPQEVKNAVEVAFQKFLADTKDETAPEYVRNLRPHTTGKLTKIDAASQIKRAEDLKHYWRSFSEWFADQVARWATTDDTARTKIDEMFAKIGAAQKRLAEGATGGRYLPADQMRQWLNTTAALTDGPATSEDVTPIAAEDEATPADAAEPTAPAGQADKPRVTDEMKASLRGLGYTNSTIFNMGYDAARRIIDEQIRAPGSRAPTAGPELIVVNVGPGGKTTTTKVPLSTQTAEPQHQSWAPEVHVEGKWSQNSTRFATKEEAEAAARDIYSRWMMAKDSRAVQSTDPINYRWDKETGLQPVEAAPQSVAEPAPVAKGAFPAEGGPDDPLLPENRTRLLGLYGPDGLLARAIAQALNEDAEPLPIQWVQDAASMIYGGSMASGAYTRDRLYDAMETGLNLFILNHADRFSPRQGVEQAKRAAEVLADLKARMPTQTVRAGDKDTLQQFSTPPDYAFSAAWVANLRPTDHVLEPTAGNGGLAVHAMTAGVEEVTGNELSEQRRTMMQTLPFARITGENAEQLHNILPSSVKPTVVIMNPPFSSAGERMGGKMDTSIGAKHIEQALKRLEKGGRLVAIVGRGMTMDAPTFKAWWQRIGDFYDVRANVGVSGDIYKKYGTNFGTRLLVIDKVPPSGRPVLQSDVTSAADLIEALTGVRDERPAGSASEPVAGQPGGQNVAGSGTGAGQPAGSIRGPTGNLGPGVGQDRPAGPVGTQPTNAGGGAPSGVRPGAVGGVAGVAGDGAPVQQPQPDEAGGNGQPAQQPGGSRGPAGSSVGGGADGARPDGGDQPNVAGVKPSETERVQTEAVTEAPDGGELTESVYEPYKPQRVTIAGAKPHPGALVQSAAMASVMPPIPKYETALPKALITSGAVSTAQLEAIIYAGAAHDQVLAALTDDDLPKRRGFFIGDGTGVGKGREVAGIILDNRQQGRKRAIWVSEKMALNNDAKRDWTGLGGSKDDILPHNKIKAGDTIKHDGILFTTYDTLRSGEKIAGNNLDVGAKVMVKVENNAGKTERVGGTLENALQFGGKPFWQVKLNDGGSITAEPKNISLADAVPKSRVDQIVEWLGEDFDGVIAFDEAHNMGNAVASRGSRGVKEAAAKAMAGLELQERLPNARVVYVSATGATEVTNLAYADRLGLWGRGTAFADRGDFLSKVAQGGVAAMELVARDMKALGLYTARSLSYDGVEYDRLQHDLTPAQRSMYDKLAEAWQMVLRRIDEALEATEANGKGGPKAAIRSAFWGGHQRFFNQLITSLQMPTVLKSVERDIAEGRQAVLQLVSTNEAGQERALNKARANDAEDLEDLDMSPRDQLLQLVDKVFPTQQYEPYIDENGNERVRPVVDADGNPVRNREAEEAKEKLLMDLGSIRVPDGPLEILIHHFGAEAVAEVTGRKQRVIRKLDKDGQLKTVVEKRGSEANIVEAKEFQDGKKKILVFSQAGGTGRSYHADNTAPSANARRSHYLVQPGWRADIAVQGFGRTHRTNQASAPLFHLVTTDLEGQKRFISSIARRLGQLGALTKGERRTGDQGMFGRNDNLESDEAKAGLTQLYRDIYAGRVEGITAESMRETMGLEITDSQTGGLKFDLPPMTQFLNRVLSLKVDEQNSMFQAFMQRYTDALDRATADGTLDTGTETYRAAKIKKQSEQVVYTDPQSGAETKHVHFETSHKNDPSPWEQVSSGKDWRTGYRRPEFYIVNNRSGLISAISETSYENTLPSGETTRYYIQSTPMSRNYIDREKIDYPPKDQFRRITDKNEARWMWDERVAKVPEYRTEDLHMITGAILPIWDRLGGYPQIYRLQADNGEKFLGRVVDNKRIAETLKALGAEAIALKTPPAQIIEQVLDGSTAQLANGWTIRRSRVANEWRLELKDNPSSPGELYSSTNELEAAGVFRERIGWDTRYFVPIGERGEKAIGEIMKRRPLVSLSGG